MSWLSDVSNGLRDVSNRLINTSNRLSNVSDRLSDVSNGLSDVSNRMSNVTEEMRDVEETVHPENKQVGETTAKVEERSTSQLHESGEMFAAQCDGYPWASLGIRQLQNHGDKWCTLQVPTGWTVTGSCKSDVGDIHRSRDCHYAITDERGRDVAKISAAYKNLSNRCSVTANYNRS